MKMLNNLIFVNDICNETADGFRSGTVTDIGDGSGDLKLGSRVLFSEAGNLFKDRLLIRYENVIGIID